MLVELKNVTKSYILGEVTVEALRGVCLNIDKGEFIGICGPSGSGKTTMLNVMSTIDSPTSGNVFFDGKDIGLMNDNEQTELRNKTIGFIFQTFNLVPVLSALENVMLPLDFRNMSRSEAKERAMVYLNKVGLEKFVLHRPSKLSGGQRQRVAIARALAQRPKIIIADEPTANLDSQNAMQILNLMDELNQKEQITFIFSTHDSRLIDKVRRIVRVEDGIIVEDRNVK